MSFECRRETGRGRLSVMRACGRALKFCLWSAITVLSVATVLAGLLLARMSQGPVTVPGLGALAASIFNAGTEDVVLTVGDAVLSLGEAGSPAGIVFRDVEVTTPDGTGLLSAPRLGARFHMSDLVFGQLQPTRIALVRPVARVVRAADGRIRVGLGDGFSAGLTMGEGESAPAAGEQSGLDVISRVIRGFVGDEPPVPELLRLDHVAIYGATVIYEDARSGRRWTTRGSTLVIRQTEDGAEADFRASLTSDAQALTGLRISARRLRGTYETEFMLRVEDLRLSDIADQVPGLGWAAQTDAPLSGLVAVGIGRGGKLSRLEGRLTASPGRLYADGDESEHLQALRLAFTWRPETERLELGELHLASGMASAHLSGLVQLDRNEDGTPAGVSGELDLGRTAVDMPGVIAEPVAFDGGRVALRWRVAEDELILRRGVLERGELTLGFEGRLDFAGEDPILDLRATAERMSTDELKRLWPLEAARNARIWVVENIIDGMIDRMVAQIRLDAEGEAVAMDFTFSDLDSRYLGEMTPITSASGRAHVTLDDLYLSLDQGEMRMEGEEPILLAGSRIAITDFSGKVTPADIDIRAEGPLPAALKLIDKEPLGLVSKLDLDPAEFTGRASVAGTLDFPLLADLLVEQVNADIVADLSDVSLRVKRSGVDLPIASDRLRLAANIRRLTLEGPVRIDGVPLTLAWSERYGDGADVRDVTARGAITPKLLARFGLSADIFTEGRIPLTARLSQRGEPSFGVELTGDLTPARLSVPPLDWSKAAGTKGRIEATGRLGPGITVERLRLAAGSLSFGGSLALSPQGDLTSATFRNVKIGELADIDLRVTPRDGGYILDLTGRHLDISRFIESPQTATTASAGSDPLEVAFNVDRIVVSPKVRFTETSGGFERAPSGAISAAFQGKAGRASFRADYTRKPDQPGRFAIVTPDAGGLLRGVGLFEGGVGGEMTLNATLAPDDQTDIAGRAFVRNMRVRDATTFQTILEEGGVEEAVEAAESGGLVFEEIDIPFRYAEGQLELEESIATSPMLAVKVAGRVDEASNTLDLSGVISPAYAVTGALDDVPLLGDLLSGGRGEGILAMTFSVNGRLDDPDFSVNPLSLLTPGILRRIFSGRSGKPNSRFIEQLRRDD